MRVVGLSAFYLFLFYVYRCACLHACVAPRVCSALGDQRKALDPLELGSHTFVRPCTRN